MKEWFHTLHVLTRYSWRDTPKVWQLLWTATPQLSGWWAVTGPPTTLLLGRLGRLGRLAGCIGLWRIYGRGACQRISNPSIVYTSTCPSSIMFAIQVTQNQINHSHIKYRTFSHVYCSSHVSYKYICIIYYICMIYI